MSDTLTLTNKLDVYEVYNLKTKVYPSGLIKLKKNSFDTIKGRIKDNSHNGTSTDEQLEKYLKKRVKERKEKIIDFAFCNSWRYFVTLTFDTKNTDYFPNGYSHDRALELLKLWINNQKHKHKNIKYIIVSEFHENGHLHFHGLFNNVNWELIPSINPNTNEFIFKNGCQLFNLKDYKYGFTSISEIKDSKKVSIYLSKYITKELISLKFRKVFWHSQNLYKPLVDYRYITNNLKDFVKDDDLLYYNEFKHSNSFIEIAEIKKGA